MTGAPPPPVAPQPSGPAGTDSGEVLSALHGRQVLLLEDEVMIAAELKAQLEACGARVRYARRLAKGLQLSETAPLDGAVLDVSLGQGDTCEAVATRLRERRVPFVLHSGDLVRAGEAVALLDAPLVAKPAAARAVLSELAGLMRRGDEVLSPR